MYVNSLAWKNAHLSRSFRPEEVVFRFFAGVTLSASFLSLFVARKTASILSTSLSSSFGRMVLNMASWSGERRAISMKKLAQCILTLGGV